MHHDKPPSKPLSGSPLGSPKTKATHIVLTDKGVKALEATNKRRIVWIQGLIGLGIRITPKGTKSFVYKYDMEGQDKWLTLGQYPKLKIHEVLTKYAEVHEKTQAGEDPCETHINKHQEAFGLPTVKQLSEEYIERYAKPHKNTWKQDLRILQHDVLPNIGNLKVHRVKRNDVLNLLDLIVARGAPIQANRTLAVIRRMFNYAIDRDIIEVSPCSRIKPPSPEKPKDRYLSLDEISIFCKQLDTVPLHKKTKLALKLLLLTLQRAGEVLGITASEINLTNATWIIPKERSKNGRAHLVPLSEPAIKIIEELLLETKDEGYLFSSERSEGHYDSAVLSKAIARNLDVFNIGKFTPHDLRRTGSTLLAAFKVPRFDRERILNHTDNTIGSVYDIHDYQDEKIAGLTLWSDIVSYCEQSHDVIDQRHLQKNLKYRDYFDD